MEQHFTVRGIPKPQARARFFVRQGKIAKYSPNQEAEMNIRAQIVQQGAQYIGDGPVEVEAYFDFPHPKSHYGAKGLRPSAPLFHTSKPDVDNCIKGLLDACRGVLWKDDTQVIIVRGQKIYTDEEPKTTFTVRRLI